MMPLAGKRVLVIEDEAIIAAMVEDMLNELGAIVVGPAATIAQGLTLAQSEAIDGAVLDVNLRSERIDPVAAALRARGIPFIYATGYGDTVAAAPGCVTVIEKPYTMESLAKAVAGMIASRS